MLKPETSKINPEVIKANKTIRKFSGNKNRDKAHYIEVYAAMVNGDGVIQKGLFPDDNLYINENGYSTGKDSLHLD